jgi:hypothetical protein
MLVDSSPLPQFCSDLPMAMILPPTIRPYWTTLLAEKAAAPAHRAWEWSSDPFAAKKEVEARQAKKQEKVSATAMAGAFDNQGGFGGGSATTNGAGGRGGDGAGTGGGRGGGIGWKTAPEVRMSGVQREYVESVIRKVRMEARPRRYQQLVDHKLLSLFR